MDLDKFWTEEISRAFEALEMRRVDPTDFERWKNFHANLKQTFESWKVKCIFNPVCAFLTNQTPYRMSYQVVMLKSYAAIIPPHLKFVDFSLLLWRLD